MHQSVCKGGEQCVSEFLKTNRNAREQKFSKYCSYLNRSLSSLSLDQSVVSAVCCQRFVFLLALFHL